MGYPVVQVVEGPLVVLQIFVLYIIWQVTCDTIIAETITCENTQ